MKAPLEIARHVVAHLDDDDRRILATELTGKTQPRAPGKDMRMCKYCGGMIHGKGVGPRCVYCQRACWTAAEGFDCKVSFDHKHGIASFDQIQEQVEHLEDKPPAQDGAHNDNRGAVVKVRREDQESVSDRGSAIEAMYDRLDGTIPNHKPKLDLAEFLQKATKIHPLLPSIIALLADGATQTKTARKLGVSQSVISEAIKSLRASRGY